MLVLWLAAGLVAGKAEITGQESQGGGMRPPIWPMQRPFPDDHRAASLIRQNNAALVALLI